MFLDQITAVLVWPGIVVFAVTGALVASRKEMDIFGFALLGTATGLGGGTLRDLLLGLPVFWVTEPVYLAVSLVSASLVYFAAHIPQSRYRVLLWLDAVGMALFAVIGTEIALKAGVGSMLAVAMGVVTAAFGGILRDILGAERPVVLSHEIYVTAAFLGASLFAALIWLDLPREVAIIAGFALGFAVRGAALRWGWSLPRYKPRPGRPQ